MMQRVEQLRESMQNTSVGEVQAEASLETDILFRLNELSAALPVRQDLHLSRKLFHVAAGGTAAVCLISGISQTLAVAVLVFLFMSSVTSEVLRLKFPKVNERTLKFFGLLMRQHEVSGVSGMPFYAGSVLFSVLVFPRPIAILAILYLAFGDPIASLVGVLYKKKSIRIIEGKSFHGTMAAFIACAVITALILHSTGLHGVSLLRLTLLGGFAGAVAELLPLNVDDNLSIPVVSGFIMWAGLILVQFL